ncbi:hypothetical protein HaLaN_03782, partial [Haematococcus lacustris]
MEAAEKLKGLGSTLGLPQRVIADAVAMLAEVRDGRLVHVGGPMNTGDAQLAGLLFLAARSASLPLTLSRAATAAQADRHAAGTQFSGTLSVDPYKADNDPCFSGISQKLVAVSRPALPAAPPQHLPQGAGAAHHYRAAAHGQRGRRA